MKLLKLTALLILLFSTSAFGQKKNQKDKTKNEKYQSLLWEISKPGVEGKSYLYGTMHVSSKVAFHLTDSFYVAIKSVDIVGLETNPEYWMKDMLKSDAYSFYMHSGFVVPTNGFYSNAFYMEPIDNRGLKYLLSTDSRFSNNLLYRKSHGYQNNFQEDTYLDMFIFQTGTKLGKVVTNLEDFEESQRLVFKSQKEDMKNRTYGYQNQYDFGGKSPFEIIEDAYRNGDLDLLDSIGRITGTEEGREYMLYIRNENIANSMDSIINKGQKLFSAVGAAHLPGPRGVIEEMRKKGYSVRPVYGSSKRDATQKDELDNIIHPYKLEKVTSSDGRFSTFLPGEIVPTPEAIIYKELQIPDMANGGIYFIKQVNTFAPLYDQSTDFYKKRVDSLLYENIPGKIIKMDQKGKDEYGHPIITIQNETKQGNAQRYKIIITPFELYIFKVSGIKEYANRKDVQLFIDSAKVYYDYDKGWRKVTPHFEGFEVEMPGAVKIQDAEKFTTINMNAFIQSYDKKSKAYFTLMQTTLSDFDYIEEDTFELKYICDNFCEKLDYKEISNISYGKTDGYPSYSHYAENEDGEGIFCKTIIKGPHYYLMVAKANKKQADQYFSSFKFKDFKTLDEMQEVVDTSMLFKVNSIARNPRSEYERSYGHAYGSDEDDDDDFLSKYDEITFFLNTTGEHVEVKYEKFHDYASRNPEVAYHKAQYASSFIDWKNEKEDVLNDYLRDELQALDEQYYEYAGDMPAMYKSLLNDEEEFPYIMVKDNFIENHPSGLKWKEYQVHHINSTRGIYGRYLVYKGRSYNLRVTIDTSEGPSADAIYLMDNFIPKDTVVGQPLGQSKDSLFFAHLTSGDSLLEMRALRSMHLINFKDADPKTMITLLDTMNFQRLDDGFNYRLDLLESAGEIDSPEILKFLEDQYYAAEDTSSLQISILSAIGKNQTIDNTKLFLKLLLKETPLTSSYKLNSLFYNFSDSLELTKNFYPDILALANVPEYTDNVYSLLLDLLDSNIIDKSFYEFKLDDIYREAKMELKRFNNTTIDRENNSNSYDYSYNYNSYSRGADYYSTGKFQSFSNGELTQQLKLLAPFYEQERVKKLFDKMIQIKDIQGVCFTAKLLDQIGVKTDLETWRKLKEENKEDNYTIYQVLKDLEEEQIIEKLGFNNDSIALAILLDETGLELEEGDSLKLKEIKELTFQDKPLLVYVYKYRKQATKKNYGYGNQEEKWTLAMICLQPKNEKDLVFSGLTETGIQIKLNKEEDEIIDKRLKALRFMNRERASYSNYDNEYYGGHY